MSYAAWNASTWYSRQNIVSFLGTAYVSVANSNYNRTPGGASGEGWWTPYTGTGNVVQNVTAGTGISIDSSVATNPIVSAKYSTGSGMLITPGSGTPASLIFQSAVADIQNARTSLTYLNPGVNVVGTPFGGTYTVQNTGVLAVAAGTGISITPSAAPRVGEYTIAATGGGGGVSQLTATDGSIKLNPTGGIGTVDVSVNPAAFPVGSVITSGPGLSSSTSAGVVTLSNTGVTQVTTSGPGIASSTTAGVATLSNTGVTQVTSADGSVVIASGDGTGTVPLKMPLVASEGINVAPGSTGGYSLATQAHLSQATTTTDIATTQDAYFHYELCGGGGGGGASDWGTFSGYSNQTFGGGGGGSGFIQSGTVFLPAGSTIGWVIGHGGDGGTFTLGSSTNGTGGGDSQLFINGRYTPFATAAGGGFGSARNVLGTPFVQGSGGNGAYGGGGAAGGNTNNTNQGPAGTGTIANGLAGILSTGNPDPNPDIFIAGDGGGNNYHISSPLSTTGTGLGGSGGGPTGGKGANAFYNQSGSAGTMGGGGGGGSTLFNEQPSDFPYLSGYPGGNGYIIYWFQFLGP